MGDGELILAQQATHVDVSWMEAHPATAFHVQGDMVFLGSDYSVHTVEIALAKPATRHDDDPVTSLPDKVAEHFSPLWHSRFATTREHTVDTKAYKVLKR